MVKSRCGVESVLWSPIRKMKVVVFGRKHRGIFEGWECSVSWQLVGSVCDNKICNFVHF